MDQEKIPWHVGFIQSVGVYVKNPFVEKLGHKEFYMNKYYEHPLQLMLILKLEQKYTFFAQNNYENIYSKCMVSGFNKTKLEPCTTRKLVCKEDTFW